MSCPPAAGSGPAGAAAELLRVAENRTDMVVTPRPAMHASVPAALRPACCHGGCQRVGAAGQPVGIAQPTSLSLSAIAALRVLSCVLRLRVLAAQPTLKTTLKPKD